MLLVTLAIILRLRLRYVSVTTKNDVIFIIVISLASFLNDARSATMLSDN
jgi:hypothetical protein